MRIAALWLCLLLTTAGSAVAAEPSYRITVKDRAFVPAELEVPAGAKIELVIRNQDKVPAEFESSQLHREKIVPAGARVMLQLGPLKPGRYEFFNDFHPSSRGHLIVK